MTEIFGYTDYKLFLLNLESDRSNLQKGFRSRLAECLGCQNAYVSQVFNSKSNFSLEQAIKICKFLKLAEIETKYFILMVEFSRAGNQELKAFFQKELDIINEKMLDVKEKITVFSEINLKDQSTYYSSWVYGAVHMLTTIPKFNRAAEIAQALNLPTEQIKKIILFLVTTGLLTEKDGKLTPGSTQIHLSKDSPNIHQHHAGLRNSAIESLNRESKNDFHYSTMSTLSEKTALLLKNEMINLIKKYVKEVSASKEENLYNFNLDFYKMTRD